MKTKLLRLIILAIVVIQSAGLIAQTTYVNIPYQGFNSSNGWNLQTTKLLTVTTQSILCGDGISRDFKYLDCIVNNTFTLSRFSKNAGYLQFPEFPTIGEITIYASSTGKDYTLQAWNGSGWNDVDAKTVTSAGSATFSYTSGVPVTLRIITKNTGGDVKIESLKIVGLAGDPVPPAYISSIPGNESTGISPGITSLKITFDKKIDKGTGNISLFDGNDNQYISILDCVVEEEDLIIPVSGLKLSTTYTVTIPSATVENQSGTPTNSEISFSFTTKSTLSSAAEITATYFGIRQIGEPVINSSESTINVTLMYGTGLKEDTKIASISGPDLTISSDATITTLPSDFSVSNEIVVTAEDGVTTKTWAVNFIQSPIVAASLPVSFKGTSTSSWKNIVEAGYASNIVNATTSQSVNSVNWYPAQISQTNQYIVVHYAEAANLVSFRMRYGQPNRAYEFKVQESTDGSVWNDIVIYAYDRAYDNITDPDPDIPNTSTTLGLRSCPLSTDSRYVRWIYTDRTATTMYLDDIVIENKIDATAPRETSSSHTTSAITLVFDEAVKIDTHHTGIKINGGSFADYEFIENNVMCNRDGNVVMSLTGLNTAENYVLTIPKGALKDLSDNDLPATTIEFENGIGVKIPTSVEQYNDQPIRFMQTGKTLFIENIAGEAELYNMTGQKAGFSINKQINVSGLSSGVYLIHYKTTSGILSTTKLIIK